MVNECSWARSDTEGATGRAGSSSAILFCSTVICSTFNTCIFDCYQRVLSVMGGRGGIKDKVPE